MKSSDNQQQVGNSKSGNLATENTTIDGQSEATIYNPAVILELSDESDNSGVKHNSTSSEEDAINLSLQNQNQTKGAIIMNVAEYTNKENNQILFQRFLDCRL